MRLLPTVPALALGALLLTAPGPTGGSAASAPPASHARPVVLMLHGRGLERQDTAALRRDWTVALGDGIQGVAGHRLLRDGDLRLVWYADALQEPGGEDCTRRVSASPRGGWARDVGGTLAAAGTLMGLAAAWLGEEEGRALRALAGDLVYLGDEDSRCGAEGRLASALEASRREGRPIILVAHSFGALVGYDHLRRRDGGPGIERFVTIGSLLGHPELRELLVGRGEGRLPPGVGSWINVRDPGDPLSAPLVGMAQDTAGGRIEDRKAEAVHGGDAHDPVRYLLDPATASAVLEAWCGASGDPEGAAEPACRPRAARR